MSIAPTLEEIQAAAASLREVIVHTPLLPTRGAQDIWLKAEIFQPVTSFKLRGVFHAVASMTPEARAAGVSTVSAGNTAQALAWAARHFDVPSRSIMPDKAPQTKIDAVRALGGTVQLTPMPEVFRYMKEHLWEDEPYAFVHPWTDRRVMTGHGSMGLEIIADLPNVETVFIPVGGGGLMGGVGSAIKALAPNVRLIAVEPKGCPSLHAAIAHGSPVDIESQTICDGVAVPYVTRQMFPLLRELADEVVLVSERAVRAAVKRLALTSKLVVEPAGALSLAAALAMPLAERGRSVCVLSGGSLDPDLLVEILQDGEL